MLRCFAGICGDVGQGEAEETKAKDVNARRLVTKPILQVGAEYAPKASSLEDVSSLCPELSAAPPGIDPPYALVSGDFRKNSSKLLVLLPSPGSAWGVWEACLGENRGDTVPLVRWATANGYAVAVMNAQAMTEKPALAWDEIMRGSPARFVAICTGGDAVPYLRQALMPLHPMMYGRLRAIFSSKPQRPAPPLDAAAPGVEDAQRQLDQAMVLLPDEWLRHSAFVMHQCMFQLFEDRFSRWQDTEMKKYMGFQGMKENDMPGLKRMPLDVRIKRMDRDRTDDELARLLKENEQATNNIMKDGEDEPGID